MKFLTASFVSLTVAASSAGATHYGCALLDEIDNVPVVEGKNGVFYRVQTDLRMSYHFPPEAVDLLGELSDALASRGTTLIYLPVPTKSLVMPESLSKAAATWRYDADIASRIFDDLIVSLEEAGVASVNLREALTNRSADDIPYYPTDYHWNSSGARRAAAAIATRLESVPSLAASERKTFQSEVLEDVVVPSALRPLIQARCRETIPLAKDTLYLTSPVIEETAALDLFGTFEGPRIVLAGTSFSAFAFSNFSGWLSEETGFDVENRSVVGGNSYAAIVSYLLGEDMTDPPDVLIWENPVYNNLFDHGDRALRELVFAAQGRCGLSLSPRADDTFELNVPTEDYQDAALRIETTAPTRQIEVTYTFDDGDQARETFVRSDRTGATAVFYAPLVGLHRPPIRLAVEAEGTAIVASIALCPAPPDA